jgi:hypothetical protein
LITKIAQKPRRTPQSLSRMGLGKASTAETKMIVAHTPLQPFRSSKETPCPESRVPAAWASEPKSRRRRLETFEMKAVKGTIACSTTGR